MIKEKEPPISTDQDSNQFKTLETKKVKSATMLVNHP